ncbi:hypothetical protein GCM10009665_75920 [Kitasatospora nipponensis]|uniref:Uncharacterized protein n=1 Tax=Kitasatospora nipponensis TaxID=258049 RepID=A0ABN1T7P1_9ACTN
MAGAVQAAERDEAAAERGGGEQQGQTAHAGSFGRAGRCARPARRLPVGGRQPGRTVLVRLLVRSVVRLLVWLLVPQEAGQCGWLTALAYGRAT